MDELHSYMTKFLQHSVNVNIYSNPQFSIETFLGVVVSIVNLLLILEVNVMFEHVRAPARIRVTTNFRESSSRESYCTSMTKVQGYYNRSLISTVKKSEKNYSTPSNYGWLMTQFEGDTLPKKFLFDPKPKIDKLEYMLSVTPSDYVRRDKERRLQASQVRECIRSLTRMLEARDEDKVPRDMIQKNLDVMQERLSLLSANDPSRYISRDTECIDETLYDLMESLVLSSSLENPLPQRNLKNLNLLISNRQNKEYNEFPMPRLDRKPSSSQITLGESFEITYQEKQRNISTEMKADTSDEEETCDFDMRRENNLTAISQQQPVPIMV